MGKKVWARTCDRCKATWYVPDHLIVVPNGLLMFGAKLIANGEQRSRHHGRGGSADYARLEQNRAEAIQLQHCPNCGERKHSQRKRSTMPPLHAHLAVQFAAREQAQPPPPEPARSVLHSAVASRPGTVTLTQQELWQLVNRMVDQALADRGVAAPNR